MNGLWFNEHIVKSHIQTNNTFEVSNLNNSTDYMLLINCSFNLSNMSILDR